MILTVPFLLEETITSSRELNYSLLGKISLQLNVELIRMVELLFQMLQIHSEKFGYFIKYPRTNMVRGIRVKPQLPCYLSLALSPPPLPIMTD